MISLIIMCVTFVIVTVIWIILETDREYKIDVKKLGIIRCILYLIMIIALIATIYMFIYGIESIALWLCNLM